ncbi:hypothetical protein F503_06492 [Ophiostoma piceae UAMH 11346]|uniref:Uncharacterized protein n=1 Tax=Ophiostoma piceae (strain UAMH 11346) TaxID=1262450 RepID=S3BWJ9_OPHP1|nr:hypothetical protein F503_06492 [Ophiostoma piceae UAMH 11346]
MPKQYVLFGRLLPPITTKRITLLLSAVFTFAVLSVIFTLPSSVPTGPSLSQFADHKFSIPQFNSRPKWSSSLNPFSPKSHAPPRQKDDSHEDSSWFSDWKWLSTPFSSSFTLDESRSLLPPLPERPPIYCYYDTAIERDKAMKDAESDLLLTWRRAWWAQGFRPVLLSSAEAKNNPRYEQLQRLKVTPGAKADIMRWLAWENMGGGILSQYLVLPMSVRTDPLLTFLRRGDYPTLTRWEGLSDGLFMGSKEDISTAIKLVLANPTLDYPFVVDEKPASIAFYDAQTVTMKYTKIGDTIQRDRPAGLVSLNQLINAHLHVAWQNLFSSGIAVLKPRPKFTTELIGLGVELGNRLAQCSVSPLEASCPPNMPKCEPCVSRYPMSVHTPPTFRNVSTLFTIGVVPHPYTFQSVAYKQSALDIPWLRRKSERDAWLSGITKELMGTGVAGGPRVLRFKQAVASDYSRSHNLWISAEQPVPDDIDWNFGFAIPALGEGIKKGESKTPVPGPERLPPVTHEKDDGPVATPEDMSRERTLLTKAKRLGASKDKRDRAMRDAVESWNLADTEAWKFARAFLARGYVERATWESEEAKYSGGAGSVKVR